MEAMKKYRMIVKIAFSNYSVNDGKLKNIPEMIYKFENKFVDEAKALHDYAEVIKMIKNVIIFIFGFEVILLGEIYEDNIKIFNLYDRRFEHILNTNMKKDHSSFFIKLYESSQSLIYDNNKLLELNLILNWFYLGVINIEYIDKFLNYWRALEQLINIYYDELILNFKNNFNELQFKQDWEETKNFNKNIKSLEYISEGKKNVLFCEKYELSFKEKEIAKLYQLRCNVAHGKISRNVISEIESNLPILKSITHQAITKFIKEKYEINLITFPELNQIEDFANLFTSFIFSRRLGSIAFKKCHGKYEYELIL